MDSIALLAALLTALLAWWLMRRRAAPGGRDSALRTPRRESLDTVMAWPPEVTRVLNPAERRAWRMLAQALPEYMVLAQLPLSRFLRVPTRNSYQEWMARVSLLCADLVVCDPASQVVAVVEVRRPPGKDSERTARRHQRMDRVLRKAGIRVLVWNDEQLPHPDAVRQQVLSGLSAMSSDEGAANVSTRVGATAPAMAAAAHLRAQPLATLHDEVLEPLGEPAVVLAEPAPSTWFDNLDTQPAPLPAR